MNTNRSIYTLLLDINKITILLLSIIFISCGQSEDITSAEGTQLIDKLILENPDNIEFVVLRGQQNMDYGRYSNAMKDFSYALDYISKNKSLVDSTDLLLMRATSFMKLGEIDKALLDINIIKKTTTHNLEIEFIVAALYFDIEDYKTALVKFSKVPRSSAYYSSALANQAYCYNELGKFENSIVKVDKSIEIDSFNFHGLVSKGDILLSNGFFEDACKYYVRGLELLLSGKLPMFDENERYISRAKYIKGLKNKIDTYCL